MSQVARLWLPPASKAEEEAAIGKIVASWMQEWFKADHAILIERSQAQTLPRMSWRGTPKVQFGFEEGALERLGMAICADAGDLANPCDRAIFAKVANEACANLFELIGKGSSAAFEQDAPMSPEPDAKRFILSWHEIGVRLVLAIDPETLTEIRRRHASRPRPNDARPILEAIRDETCKLGLYLGRSNLTVRDLTALTEGDVVMLDGLVRKPASLVVAGHYPQRGIARIKAAAEQIEIIIEEPVSFDAREVAPE